MNTLQDYRSIATQLHGEQKYNEYPYSFHLACVEMVARQYSFLLPEKSDWPLQVRIAAWFHDVLEDCPWVSVDTLHQLELPPSAIELVKAVTDGPGTNRSEKKQAMFVACAGNLPATFLKL